MNIQPLIGKTLDELKVVVSELGMPGFAAKQIADWLYKKRIVEIDEMTNLSIAHRERLKEQYTIGREVPVNAQHSKDGTVKYLFAVNQENNFIESVYIPDKERATLCVSSQVGCKMNCLFCMTGKQGFSAQLSAAEIMNQILSVPNSEKLTNLVTIQPLPSPRILERGVPFENF